jgi:hypothetical protein
MSWDWKYWLAFAIGALALALGILETKARPSVSLESPLDPANVMSTQFILENDTWFDFVDMKAAAIIKNLDTTFGHVGTIASGWNTLPIAPELKAGDKRTIPYPLQGVSFGGTVTSGDFGLIISYRPRWWPFWERRRGFLFTIGVQADGHSRFQQQPGEGIEREYQEYEENKAQRIFPPN